MSAPIDIENSRHRFSSKGQFSSAQIHMGEAHPPEAHPLSFSMQIDEGQGIGCSPPAQGGTLADLKVRPRNMETWVPDDTVTACFACKRTFRIYFRKHHCRACGRIFCYKCANNWDVLPRDLERFPSGNNSAEWLRRWMLWCRDKSAEKERTCDKCSRKLERTRNVWDLVRVFDLLKLDVVRLAQCGLVCKSWCRAALSSLSAFREIQYRIPMQPLSERECAQLWINREHFRGHSRWCFQLLRASAQCSAKSAAALEIAQSRERPRSCWRMMCGRYCTRALTAVDALPLLALRSEALFQYGVALIRQSEESAFELLLPLLLLRMQSAQDRMLFEEVCARALERPLWRTRLYHHVSTLSVDFERLLRERTHADEARLLVKGARVLSSTPTQLQVAQLPARLPFHTHMQCTRVHYDRIRVKRSATRPTLVPMQFEGGGEIREVALLYKREDLRGDVVVMQVIRYMDRVLRQEERLELGIVTYEVIPMGSDAGIIEIVESARTLYEIRHTQNQSLLNYLLECNAHMTVEEVRSRFVKSTAAYCVITFLLGVGDRHLENIMLTRDARLFHIDYGFLLGTDPKPMAAPVMRISQDMVDAIGGIGSESYREFQRLCTQIYNCLRRHVQEIAAMLWPLAQLGVCTEEHLREEILTRFVPGENHLEARLQLTTRLQDSQRSTYGPTVDFFHHTSLTASKTLKDWLTFLWHSDE